MHNNKTYIKHNKIQLSNIQNLLHQQIKQHLENFYQSIFLSKQKPFQYKPQMNLKTTAKFGINNNESIIDRFKTQITQNIGRSQMLIQGQDSHMNVSDLQLSKQDFIIVNGTHQINPENKTIYRCQICDRLRAICPYKNYKTYDYCQKCTNNVQQKRIRPRIFDSLVPSISKDLSSTFNDTRGHSINQNIGGNKHLQQVNKVRFIQTNNVYPLNRPISNYSKEQVSNQWNQNRQQKPRSTSTYQFKQTLPINHHIIKQKVYQQSNIEQIIFYPVIHNKLVYKSATKADNNDDQILRQTVQIGRSRYQSHHSGKKIKTNINKTVSDFLHTTKPDEVLTPSQFKKLADSIYRENNPNIEED